MSRLLSIFILFIFILLSEGIVLKAQEKDETETQKEYVEVINIEVIVRALKKGQLVGGLEKSDFTLYENGQKQEITSFMEIKRKIGSEAEGIVKKEEESAEQPGKKRFFLLYFWIYEPDPRYQDALNYFFNRVYREGDLVLVIVENQSFRVTRKEQIPQTLAQVISEIDEVTRGAKIMHERLLANVKELFRVFAMQYKEIEDEEIRYPQRYSMDKDRKRRLVSQFVTNYKNLWGEYKYKHTQLNIDKLKALAASLKTVNFEKWGLVFYQHDTFPQFNAENFTLEKQDSVKELLEMKKMLYSFSTEMHRPSGSLSVMKEIQETFVDANTTFHLLLSKVSSSPSQIESQYLKIENVYSDWQEIFRKISEATGGEVIDSTKLEESLAQAVEKEDIYYRLTYAPKITEEKVREIKVKIKQKRLKALYPQQVILKKASEITIDNFSFTHPTLQFTLNNYQQLFDGSQLYGELGIKVSAVDSKGEMSTFEKSFEPNEEKLTVSLNLNFSRGGKYTLIVEAVDKQTGKSSVYSERVKVPEISLDEPVLITKVHKKTKGIDKDNKLDNILEKSAKYCEKLEKTTFYFYCIEEIADIYFLKGKRVKNDLYLNEYQILMEEHGKMSEKREAIEKNPSKKGRKKKKSEGDQLLLTNFFSQYPFLMPTTMLGRENQKKYRYQLLSKEKIGDVETYKISVDPKKKGVGGINHGVVWVDVTDGSVVKIELNPLSLMGIRTLIANARKKGTKIRVTDTHWYEVKKNRIRFPSKTEIRGIDLAKHEGDTTQPIDVEVEHSSTVFNYKDYRFFRVNVNVVDEHHK
jgi:hypothetical protein